MMFQLNFYVTKSKSKVNKEFKNFEIRKIYFREYHRIVYYNNIQNSKNLFNYIQKDSGLIRDLRVEANELISTNRIE